MGFPLLARHFDRDPETNEVLWFSAPPVNAARPPQPKHSLAYLHFLAMKRKKEKESAENGMDVDAEAEAEKRRRFQAPPTARETLGALLAEMPPSD